MEASKAIKKVADFEMSYRDRIKAHYRTRGRVQLTDKDREILDRAEKVQEILMANRSSIGTAKELIKKALRLTHREEVNRAIEDATYLLGVSFTMDRSYQRMVQWQDIEWAIQIAKENKDWVLYEKMLLRREKLFQLEKEDPDTDFEYFAVVNIYFDFRPELFTKTLPSDYMARAMKIKEKAMKDIGLLEDVQDAEYITTE